MASFLALRPRPQTASALSYPLGLGFSTSAHGCPLGSPSRPRPDIIQVGLGTSRPRLQSASAPVDLGSSRPRLQSASAPVDLGSSRPRPQSASASARSQPQSASAISASASAISAPASATNSLNHLSPGLGHKQPRPSRPRTASASAPPLGLDLSSQYRAPLGLGHHEQCSATSASASL